MAGEPTTEPAVTSQAEFPRLRLSVTTELFGIVGGRRGQGRRFLHAVGVGVGRAPIAFEAGSALNESYEAFFSGSVQIPSVALGLGYVFGDRRALLGAEAGLTYHTRGKHAGFTGEFVPYFRWLFTDRKVRPYLDAHFGINGGVGHYVAQEWRVFGVLAGGGAGLSWFASPKFSLDAGVAADFLKCWCNNGVLGTRVPDQGWGASLRLGVSFWLLPRTRGTKGSNR